MGPAGERLRRSALFGYGLAFASVAMALGLAVVLLRFNSPLTFTGFALTAIAITFWCGGTNPGIVAVILSTLARSYFFPPEITPLSRMLYDSLFLVFALVMNGFMRSRKELVVEVAEQTVELAQMNKDLKLEIAERKRAEDRIRLIIDTIPTMTWTLDPNGAVDFVNQRWLDYTGLSLEEEIAEPTLPVHPEDLSRVIEKWQADMAAVKPSEDEIRLRRADGEYRWFLVRTSPLRDERGNLVKWYGVSVDIEDRKQAEQERSRAEHELRQAEARIRAVLEYSPNWIFLKDTEGRYLLVNREIERVFGISQEQFKGKMDSDVFPPERAAEYRANDLKVLRAGLAMEFEEIALLEDGPHTSIVHKFPLFDTHGNIYATGGVGTDITERVRAEEELKRLSAKLLRFQDEERRRIARELHDTTGQNLVALATMLGQLGRLVSSGSSGDRKSSTLLSECKALADQCIREVRTLSYVLHPPVLDEAGIEEAIRDYAKGFTNRSGVQVDLDLPPSLGRVGRDIELTVFRVVQEALTNIQRHSSSEQAKIRIYRNSNLTLEISDLGRGFATTVQNGKDEPRFEFGVGIHSMRDRVNLIGGQFSIDSTSQGTTVRVTIPLEGGQK